MAQLRKTEKRNQTDLFTRKSYQPPTVTQAKPFVHPKPQKSPQRFELINRFKILPNYSVQYAQVWYPFGKEPSERPADNKSKGLVSEKAAKRIRTAMTWLMFFSKRKFVYSQKKKKGFWFRLNFITLTLSSQQNHSDKFIVDHMLQPFLKWMNRNHNVINYVWKAETQDNGNIHFHITTNKFIHYSKIREKWNQLQQAHGYVKNSGEHPLLNSPPSTEIKSVVNDREIIGYMTKYITKTFEERKNPHLHTQLKFITNPIEREIIFQSLAAAGLPFVKRSVTCKTWGCNYTLSRINCTISESDEDFWNQKNHFISNFCTPHAVSDYFTMYLNRINLDSKVTIGIANKFRDAYQMFMTSDDQITKYRIE